MSKKRMKVCFSRFSSKRINADPRGWGAPYADLYLRLTSGFKLDGKKSIDALDEVLNPPPGLKVEKPLFECIGRVDAETPDQVWAKIQNLDEGHELDDRSMMIGDVVIDEGDNRGFIVENTGWSELSREQVERFKQMPIRRRK